MTEDKELPNDDALHASLAVHGLEARKMAESKAAGIIIDEVVADKCRQLGVDPREVLSGSPLDALDLAVMPAEGARQ